MSSVLCTILNDDFTIAGIVMLSSFLKKNKFDGDIIIFKNDKYSSITDENQHKLIKTLNYPITFYDVDESEYVELIGYFISKSKPSLVRLVPSVFTFEIFNLCVKYDKILYLDADMLIVGSIMDLFEISKPGVYVTPAVLNYNPTILWGEFNGGFLYLNNIGENKIKNELIELGLTMPDITLLDQPIMNNYFKDKVNYLPCNYNCGKRAFPDTNMSKFNKNIKIIHYVGSKPWDENKTHNELRYSKLESLWFNELNRTIY